MRATREHGQDQYSALTWPQALWVGVYQACALLPGVSRSGATIAGGIHVGLERRQAATFAFLLAIPAILGAGALELREALAQQSSSTSLSILLVGFICSFVVGLFALTVLIRFVERGRLALFAYYLVPLGLAVIVWQLAT